MLSDCAATSRGRSTNTATAEAAHMVRPERTATRRMVINTMIFLLLVQAGVNQAGPARTKRSQFRLLSVTHYHFRRSLRGHRPFRSTQDAQRCFSSHDFAGRVSDHPL